MARVCDETGVAAPGDGDLTAEVALRKDLLRLQLASTLMRLSLWQSHDITRPSDVAALEKLRRLRHALELGFATLHQEKHDAKALAIREKNLSRVCVTAAGGPAKACIASASFCSQTPLCAHPFNSAEHWA